MNISIRLFLKNAMELYLNYLKVLVENCNIAFVTTASFVGNECYRRSATFLMLKAFYAVAGRNNIEKNFCSLLSKLKDIIARCLAMLI